MNIRSFSLSSLLVFWSSLNLALDVSNKNIRYGWTICFDNMFTIVHYTNGIACFSFTFVSFIYFVKMSEKKWVTRHNRKVHKHLFVAPKFFGMFTDGRLRPATQRRTRHFILFFFSNLIFHFYTRYSREKSVYYSGNATRSAVRIYISYGARIRDLRTWDSVIKFD